MITRLRLGLSHLRDHKLKHSFQDCLNPICSCGIEVETTAHFLLHCPNYLHERKTLLDKIKSAPPNTLEQSHLNLNFRYRVCFEQGVPGHSGGYREWMHSEMRT